MRRGLLAVGALLALTVAIPVEAQTSARRGMLPIEGAITNPDLERAGRAATMST